MPRSSISKTPLRLANSIGLIDGGYRGEIMACCDNIKDYEYTIEKGQRLFQLLLQIVQMFLMNLLKNYQRHQRSGRIWKYGK